MKKFLYLILFSFAKAQGNLPRIVAAITFSNVTLPYVTDNQGPSSGRSVTLQASAEEKNDYPDRRRGTGSSTGPICL